LRQLQVVEVQGRAATETAAIPAPVAESTLLQQVQAGDKAAFGFLVDRHVARASSLAMRVVHHREDAEDLVQESFLAALRAIGSFDARRPFWPWLSRIIVNRGLDLVVTRNRRAAEPLDDAMHDARSNASLAVESREVMEGLDAALAAMPPRRRLITELFEIDGLTVGEIAEQTGVTATTVRWHLHQARKTLRACLQPFRADTA
jgi:RNA polymerase sigma-70 factor (ECF subfamily)